MKSIQLGYKAFDIHELTCHFVAEQAGLYAARGIDVSLVDTRRTPDDELPDELFSVACGAALMRWLRGEAMKVVFVATDKPMFVLCVRAGIVRLDDLRGCAIASFPGAAPPAYFLRIVLEDAGFDCGQDVQIEPMPDDAARLEKLRSGEADATVLSSAVLPVRSEEQGLTNLLCFGDRIRVPTTGLAVSLAMFKRDPQSVAAMRDAYLAAIRLVHNDSEMLRNALTSLFTDDDDLDAAGKLVRDFYTSDGLIRFADVEPGVRRLAAAMGVSMPTESGSLYDCTARLE